MATELQAFTNHEFGTIRTIDHGGQVLFSGQIYRLLIDETGRTIDHGGQVLFSGSTGFLPRR